MTTITVPWAVWYGDKFDMTFPDSWEITVAGIKGGPDIGDRGIRQALAEPIGALPLRQFARGRRDCAILIDDLTRPTPSYRIVPYILEELAAAGLDESKVRIICAIASHRPMTRQDLVRKLGDDLVQRLEIINHNASDNLEFCGRSSLGIPIWVNREFVRSDLKIAAGMITPRGGFFGGGSKLLLPGVCGRETIFANHCYCPSHIFRQHIDEVARIVGLDYIVNPLLNTEGGIMAMVAGDPEQAFLRGVALGEELYGTEIPEGMDIVICNAWPKDSEGTQCGMGMIAVRRTARKLLAEGSTLVLASACSEGLGYHSVMGPGTLFRTPGRPGVVDRPSRPERNEDILFSPNLNAYDVRALHGDGVRHCRTWPELIEILERKHGASARVCVFPCGAMQYALE